ncbi:MAG: discoidin domain-containing protein [Planctomycetes bacterium]|nr:discoidin domain-containing protein [Planctomycetota bacterium]
MYRKTTLLGLLVCLALSSMVSATMVHQDWDTGVALSRQAIIDFLVDLVNPVPVPDVDEIIDESLYRGTKDNYVAKFYGWLTVPESGNYQFHYACDDYGMLMVSQDEEMANAVEVAWVDGWTGNAEWNKYTTQHSEVMSLKKGQVMAIMAFYQEAGGGDNMDIGWTGPGLSSDITNPTYLTDWITHIPPIPTRAKRPAPADEAIDVPREVVLSWTPGKFAATTNGHKVYFGQSFNDVNDAIGGVAQDANSYTPAQRLDFGTTYYWRIDEVNAPPTSQIEFKGKVWQFTTEPIAYPIENVTATASSTGQPGMEPENTINGSGLDANDLHSTEAANMWISDSEPNGAWIEYELDKIHKLHQMWVWNANQTIESIVGFGFKDVTIEYSTNGTDYTTLGTTHEFARALGADGYEHNTTIGFGGAAAKYVRLTANSNWGGIMDKYGLSEVLFFSIPVFAREPNPDSGATDVAVDVTLGFRAGREAVTHNVYLSTDEQAVTDGNAPVTTVTETSYGPLSLDLGTTYYWKINEVNETETPTTWQGEIWNFSTHEFFVVDGFEDYNDYPPDEIWSTWIDGYGVSANGATVGYPNPDWNLDEHYVETAIVHGGDQSMPFFYDNTGAATYSEGERTFAVPQDWTKASVQTLTLWFSGTPGSTGQLYVKVNGSKVVYDGDAGNLAIAGWQVWNIDLASFGTSLQNVTTLGIGIDGSGASGTLYFDDIRLYPYGRQFITPAEPNSAGLIGHWEFDEGFGTTAGDSSGNGNDGTINGGPQWVTGQIGGALDFDGVDDFVFTGKSASDLGIDANKPKTVTAWVYTRAFNNGGIFDLGNRSDGQDFSLRTLDTDNRWRTQHWGGANDHDFDYPALNVWVHFALVYDGTESTVYANGIVVSSKATNLNTTDNNPFQIGVYGWQVDYFDGIIDDVRIYDYALSLEDVAWLAGRTEPFDKPF